ncbi:hypothetical protein RB2150_10801 [Rhodobacteraceae bacterium HTCC2150]|nr:hypothetical protein RB2150_10801 [Rhodobacteraceae bacterium HTCC2150]
MIILTLQKFSQPNFGCNIYTMKRPHSILLTTPLAEIISKRNTPVRTL